MATEEGTVIAVDNDTARIKTVKSAACEACAAKSSCNAMGGGNDMEVNAINTVHAEVGDTVILKFETTSLLKATFLLYVFPILCLLAGAVIGEKTAPLLGVDPIAFSAILGFAFFGAAIFFVRYQGNRMGALKQYQPRILRIKKKGAGHQPDAAS